MTVWSNIKIKNYSAGLLLIGLIGFDGPDRECDLGALGCMGGGTPIVLASNRLIADSSSIPFNFSTPTLHILNNTEPFSLLAKQQMSSSIT